MENQRRNHVEIEMDEEVLANAKPVLTTESCIYRVPRHIGNLNPGAYTPNFVSIGPFHCDNNYLLSMKSQKQLYCYKFVERAAKVGTTFEELISFVQVLEPSVRACYSQNIKLTQQTFVNVIFVDCGFIFELFLKSYFNEWTDDDAIRAKPWLTNIRLDLGLLENQLPFFALVELYNLAFASRQIDSETETEYPSFLKLVFHNFDSYNKLKLSATDADATSIKHFTDLLRTFHLYPSNQIPSREDEPITHLNSATELNEAKMEFEVNEQSRCLLNLEILRGHRLCYLVQVPRLKIPQIKVEDVTEILFRNMVALEHCHYSDKSYVTDYVVLLSFLVKTGMDVDLLVKKKIIVNLLGESNAVAKLFNGLWTNIIQQGSNSKYVAICRDLDAFYVCYTRKATFKQDYWNTPWKKFASFAAILVIFLTIIQTVCSILQVV